MFPNYRSPNGRRLLNVFFLYFLWLYIQFLHTRPYEKEMQIPIRILFQPIQFRSQVHLNTVGLQIAELN